jgi:hypothetical protein
LFTTGKDRLGLPSTDGVHVVLADDGTEVDNEDYFVFLPHNSTLMGYEITILMTDHTN